MLFIAETAFSHPSKLALIRSARDAGSVIALHAVLIPEDLAVARVQRRERHRRLWPLVATAIE